ncbi:hypothetical protein E2320_013690 [Naja naja]|nr:hypothetical protein E2320_013690 [Naja naja]
MIYYFLKAWLLNQSLFLLFSLTEIGAPRGSSEGRRRPSGKRELGWVDPLGAGASAKASRRGGDLVAPEEREPRPRCSRGTCPPPAPCPLAALGMGRNGGKQPRAPFLVPPRGGAAWKGTRKGSCEAFADVKSTGPSPPSERGRADGRTAWWLRESPLRILGASRSPPGRGPEGLPDPRKPGDGGSACRPRSKGSSRRLTGWAGLRGGCSVQTSWVSSSWRAGQPGRRSQGVGGCPTSLGVSWDAILGASIGFKAAPARLPCLPKCGNAASWFTPGLGLRVTPGGAGQGPGCLCNTPHAQWGKPGVPSPARQGRWLGEIPSACRARGTVGRGEREKRSSAFALLLQLRSEALRTRSPVDERRWPTDHVAVQSVPSSVWLELHITVSTMNSRLLEEKQLLQGAVSSGSSRAVGSHSSPIRPAWVAPLAFLAGHNKL